MKQLIQILLVALSISSCMNSNKGVGDIDVLPTSDISISEATEILAHADQILLKADKDLRDLEDVSTEVSSLYGRPVSNFTLVSAVRMTKNLSQSKKQNLRVTDKLINEYADGEYGWISKALE